MAINSIHTGNDKLDEDLKAFFEWHTPPNIEKLKRSLKSGRLDLPDVIPDPVLKIVTFLSVPANLDSIPKLDAETRGKLDRIHDMIIADFAELLKHPEVKNRIALLHKGAGEDSLVKNLRLNFIGSVGHFPIWFETADRLCPALRVGFYGQEGELLFDPTMSWADAIFVADRMIDMLLETMKNKAAEALMEKGALNVLPEATGWERLEELGDKIAQLRSLASTYSIKLSSTDRAG